MSLEVRVNMQIWGISPKILPEIEKDIELLSRQPLVEVFPGFKDKRLDYGKGFRTILVTRDSCESKEEMSLEYTLIDHAYVEDTAPLSSIIGSQKYTRRQIEELRKQNQPVPEQRPGYIKP